MTGERDINKRTLYKKPAPYVCFKPGLEPEHIPVRRLGSNGDLVTTTRPLAKAVGGVQRALIRPVIAEDNGNNRLFGESGPVSDAEACRRATAPPPLRLIVSL
ncbi:hypothetical protein J6590_057394 [Homalodisca vitripennis]|nr:hypothetical protein J6590_057394 [Homalodisca vitripennis]